MDKVKCTVQQFTDSVAAACLIGMLKNEYRLDYYANVVNGLNLMLSWSLVRG